MPPAANCWAATKVPGPPSFVWIGPDGEERRAQRITGEVNADAFLQRWTQHSGRPLMLTLTIGTFAIALNHILLISALILATLVGWRVAKRGGENPESVLFSLFLTGHARGARSASC